MGLPVILLATNLSQLPPNFPLFADFWERGHQIWTPNLRKNLGLSLRWKMRPYIRLLFAYNASMFPTPSGRKTFVVTCKRCRRDVPSGRDEFPFQSIAVECSLCGELRRYLPSEVFLGRPDQLVVRKRRSGGR